MSIRTLLLIPAIIAAIIGWAPSGAAEASRPATLESASESMLRYVGGCMWSGSQDVAVSDGYAYLAMHHGLAMLDISNPSSPTLEAFLFLEQKWIWSVAAAGNYVYLIDYSGLKIIDVSVPGSPVLVGVIDTPGNAYDVTVLGNYAYVVQRYQGLQIIDISDPLAPKLAGSCAVPDDARAVVVKDTLAYIAALGYGLQIIDVADPSSPHIIGACDPGAVVDLAVSGPYAYLACSSGGLQVVNVANPANPFPVVGLPTSLSAAYIVVADTIAYVSDVYSGMAVINIADPSAPVEIAGPEITGRAAGADGFLYMTEWYGGLNLVDISDPMTLHVEGSYAAPRFGTDVVIKGNYAYGAAEQFNVIDISDPQAPYRVGGTPDGGGRYLTVLDTTAYVVSPDSTFEIVNVTDPTAPFVVGSLDTVGYAYDVAASDDHAFVPVYQKGLVLINTSDPQSPYIEATFPQVWRSDFLYLAGNLLYTQGVQIYDVSDPAAPVPLGSFDGYGDIHDAVVVDTLAYLAAGISELMSGALQIASVADPENPYPIDYCYLHNEALRVAVSGRFAFVTDYYSLQVVDISDPLTPTRVAAYDGYGFLGVATDGAYIYVAGEYGFLIFTLVTTCGDASGDGIIDLSDVIYLVNYIFKGGPEPIPQICSGDANGDGGINIADAVYIVNYVFKSGPPPVETCCQ